MQELKIESISDLLACSTGHFPNRYQPSEPRPDSLNAPGIPDFRPVPDALLVEVKKIIPYETWLFIKGADLVNVAYPKRITERNYQSIFMRLFHPLIEGVNELSLTHQVIVARSAWVRYKLGADPSLPKAYYERAAEAIIEQALKREAERFWKSTQGDNNDPQILGGDKISHIRQPAILDTEPSIVSPQRFWVHGLYHPGFDAWWMEEISRRSLKEIDAFLNVNWKLEAELQDEQWEHRHCITPEEADYLLNILRAEESNATDQDKLKLHRVAQWFTSRLQTVASTSSKSTHVLLDPWSGILQNGLTLEGLTNVLIGAKLISDRVSLNLTEESKPRTWRAAVEALRERKFISASSIDLERAIRLTYGSSASLGRLPSVRTLQEAFNTSNADARKVYNQVKDLLPQ